MEVDCVPGLPLPRALNIAIDFVFLIFISISLCFVCEQHLVHALDAVKKRWRLSDEVAGALLYAMASSVPIIVINCADVFLYQSNIGLGTVMCFCRFTGLSLNVASDVFTGIGRRHFQQFCRVGSVWVFRTRNFVYSLARLA
jgi:Ca2+/Na+ antiporter